MNDTVGIEFCNLKRASNFIIFIYVSWGPQMTVLRANFSGIASSWALGTVFGARYGNQDGYVQDKCPICGSKSSVTIKFNLKYQICFFMTINNTVYRDLTAFFFPKFYFSHFCLILLMVGFPAFMFHFMKYSNTTPAIKVSSAISPPLSQCSPFNLHHDQLPTEGQVLVSLACGCFFPSLPCVFVSHMRDHSVSVFL